MQTTARHGGGVVVPQQQQTAATAPPAMAVTYQQANVVLVDQGLGSKYNAASGRATGWVQLVCAIASVILGIVELVLGSPVAIVGYGIWGGILFFLPTGILGIVSANKNTCVIIGYMVMSILSALQGFVVLSMGCLAATTSSYSGCGSFYFGRCGEEYRRARIAVDSILAIVGLVEFITAIVAACYCCAGVCCGRGPQQSAAVVHYPNTAAAPVIVTTTTPYAQQQVVGNYGGQTSAFGNQSTGPGYPVATAHQAPYPYPVEPSYPQQHQQQQPPITIPNPPEYNSFAGEYTQDSYNQKS